MIKIYSEKHLNELLENYKTFDEVAREQGVSVRTIYRHSYDYDDVITVKLCLPGERKRQIRLIHREKTYNAADVLREGLELRNKVRSYFGDELPGQMAIEDLPWDDLDPFDTDND